jgi:hypothetical protein
MNSEPPGPGDAQEEGPANGPTGSDVDRRSSGAGRVRWFSIVTVIGVLAVAGGIGAFLLLNQNSGSNPDQVAPALGLACPYLQEAADAYNRGDRVAYNEAISRAEQIAKGTLQTSGESFGEPERIALDLALSQTEHPERLLTQAQDVCSQFARPSSS